MIRFVKWVRFHIDTPGIFGNFSFGIPRTMELRGRWIQSSEYTWKDRGESLGLGSGVACTRSTVYIFLSKVG
jgi:hypothetical protein